MLFVAAAAACAGVVRALGPSVALVMALDAVAAIVGIFSMLYGAQLVERSPRMTWALLLASLFGPVCVFAVTVMVIAVLTI